MNLAGVLRGRARLAHHRFFAKGRRGGIVTLVLMVLLALALGAGLGALFDWLAQSGFDAPAASNLLAILFVAGLLGLLVFDLQEGVSVLLLDSDLELLRRAPISPVAVLGLKFLDALPRSSTMLVVLVLPATFAFAASYPIAPWAWPLVALALVGLWAIPLGLGVGGAMHLLAYVPARRAREALALLSTLILLSLWLANSFLLPRLASPEGPPAERLRALLSARHAMAAFSPAHWAAAALAAGADAEAVPLARAALALLVAGAASLGFAVWSAGFRLEQVQSRLAVAVAVAPRVRRGARREPARARPVGQVRAILARDGRLIRRDWVVLGDVLTAAALWTLLPLLSVPLHAVPPFGLTRVMLLALSVGLGYEIAARAIPFEREAAAWMAMAPLEVSRWLAAKLAGALILALPMLAVAATAIAIAFPLALSQRVESVALALAALTLALPLGLWTGVKFGDPKWIHPRAMLTFAGRLTASALLLLQAGAWFAVSEGLRALGLPPVARILAAFVLAGILALAPLRAAAIRLARKEWPA